ncbi:hypothetical protein MBLNU459_g1257t1 [Dothideomycetes sp. NU459]
MQFTFHALCALAAASYVTATADKANEYKTHDCSGNINFGHHPLGGLGDVTMDITSNSVYVAFGQDAKADAYPANTGNGGTCTGSKLGSMHGACNDLFQFGTKTECLRFHN